MIRIFIALALIAPTLASAASDPGPPPWLCHPAAACDGANKCIALPSAPMSFYIHRDPILVNGFILDGLRGDQSPALQFDTLQDAEAVIEIINDGSEKYGVMDPRRLLGDRIHSILISSRDVMDAVSFRLYGIATRGDKRFIQENSIRISCGDLLNAWTRQPSYKCQTC